MNNFKTLVLSLQKDVDRRDWMNSIKSKIGLDFEFFDAFTPNQLTDSHKHFFRTTDFHIWNINEDAVKATFVSHMLMCQYAIDNNTNLLIIEDDIDIVKPIDWSSVDFTEFDIWNLTAKKVACFAYFISVEGAIKLLKRLNRVEITQAYDWELSKIDDSFKVKEEKEPIFIQVDRFESNIAPNGYEKLV